MRLVAIALLFLCLANAIALAHDPAAAVPGPASAAAAIVPLDLNEATREQFDTLPGIGPALADRIVAHREERGPFQRVEQLGEVRGIGPKILEKLRPYLFVQ